MLTKDGNQHHIELYKMKCQQRYDLISRPNRPEELYHPDSNLGISFGYGCGEVRTRVMINRDWVMIFDHQAGNPDLKDLFRQLDLWFNRDAETA